MSEIGGSWGKDGASYWETDGNGLRTPISADEYFRRMQAAVEREVSGATHTGDTWLCARSGRRCLLMASPDHAATRFRKKPVEIEAIRWDGTEECLAVVLPWINFDSLPDDGIHVGKGVGYVPALGTLA